MINDTKRAAISQTLSAQDAEEFYLLTTPTIAQARGTRRITNVSALTDNYRKIVEDTNKGLIAVVKARGYGSGLIPTSEALYEAGCRAFAVATLGAGIALREKFQEEGRTDAIILVLGYTSPEAIALAREYSLTVSITDADVWESYERELGKTSSSQEERVSFQINVDTGMTRVGISAWHEQPHSIDHVVEVARKVHDSSVAQLTGIYTHFPLADEEEYAPGTKPYEITRGQVDTMNTIVERLRSESLPTGMVHLANSGAIERFSFAHNQEWITHVRPGSLLYGMSANFPDRYRRVARWETSLARVETVSRDVGVGYSHTHQAKEGDHIGTLTVGYGDGYFNTASPDEHNIVRLDGTLLDVIGTVAMDMCMVDLNPYVKKVGRVPQPDDNLVIELLSDKPTDDPLSPEKVAARWGTFWWVLLTGIRTRNELIVTDE